MFCAAINLIVVEVSVLCCHQFDSGGGKFFFAAVKLIVVEVSVLCCHQVDSGGGRCFLLPSS